ncbi:MAG: phenylalanyl-tRNA synthetase beta subunit [Candidatus Syntrophoarchaeum caldarius]|uniref:Phenylalanine--tRNA ligase beta subunit n=1 Tax=Candidatus Syntropharchaeum caldarium TaxID=1838285 RepID=A0A1F2PCF9_9EURY|nr:MAG: phenylalanyl-tRNA synthetase beta subunit [Candidatus Syntrophoarchaeum caldarius]
MPIISLNYRDLEDLTGLNRDDVIRRIPMIGADIERIEDDHVDVEFFPNRPDLFSVEGVARAMRTFMGSESGIKVYNVEPSDVILEIDPSVKPLRPFIVCAVVRDLDFTIPSFIEALMGLQEHLHWVLGRDRKRVSIGVHDISRVKPPFTYLGKSPDFAFVPLDYDYEMTMEEILHKHPKGIKFANILEGMDQYPLIIDANGDVLSFPPIINGELTRVTENTRDVFIDVTGTTDAVEFALNILATALIERGGDARSVELVDLETGTRTTTPDLTPAHMSLSVKKASNLIGINLSADDCRNSLERMGFGIERVDGENMEVLIPAYRPDILHDFDLIEDIAIGYGYDRITPEMPVTPGVGSIHPLEVTKSAIRDVLVGLGFYEVMTFTLTSPLIQFERMRWSSSNSHLSLMHPINEEQTILRPSILPNLLEILALNRHRELPQQVFEIGDVIINERDELHLAAVSIHHSADFAEVRSLVDAVIHELWSGQPIQIVPSNNSAFIEGRRADIILNDEIVGFFGEFHPDVITAFELEYPTVGFEINVSKLEE